MRTFDEVADKVMVNLGIASLSDPDDYGWQHAPVDVPAIKPYEPHIRSFYLNRREQSVLIRNRSCSLHMVFALAPLQVRIEQCDFTGRVAARPCGPGSVAPNRVEKAWDKTITHGLYDDYSPIHHHLAATALQGL